MVSDVSGSSSPCNCLSTRLHCITYQKTIFLTVKNETFISGGFLTPQPCSNLLAAPARAASSTQFTVDLVTCLMRFTFGSVIAADQVTETWSDQPLRWVSILQSSVVRSSQMRKVSGPKRQARNIFSVNASAPKCGLCNKTVCLCFKHISMELIPWIKFSCNSEIWGSHGSQC